MKRFFALALALALLLSLSACSGEPAQSGPATPEAAGSSDLPSAVQPAPQKSPEAQIQETVVYDDGLFKLTAKEIDYSDPWEVRVKLLAENNSDQTVAFVGNYCTINGITVFCNIYIEVAPGKKANGCISINPDDLNYVGIREIATITAQDTYIFNTTTFDTLGYFTFSLETSVADGYNQPIDDSGELLYERDGIRVLYRGMETDWMGQPVLSVFVENTSATSCTVHVEESSVNGFMIYANMAVPAYAGTVTYGTIDFLSTDLEENDIDTFDEVCFKLWAYDSVSFNTLWTSDELTIIP